MQQITWLDKDKTLPTSDVRRWWRDVDINELKDKFNANVVEIPTLIQTAVDDLIAGAPGALDTLNELAAALADDAAFATTVTNALAAKQATLVSGTNIKTLNSASLLGAGDIDLTSFVNGLINATVIYFSSAFTGTGTIGDPIDLVVPGANFIDGEVPAGSGTAFTLANTPIVGSVKLYRNGVRQTAGGVDYTISGVNITLTSTIGSDTLLADYRM